MHAATPHRRRAGMGAASVRRLAPDGTAVAIKCRSENASAQALIDELADGMTRPQSKIDNQRLTPKGPSADRGPVGRFRKLPRGGGQDSTISRVCPVGSRNQNIGGTGAPMRNTCASTSTPSSVMAW